MTLTLDLVFSPKLQELDMCDDEIRIEGVAEPFFFHVIYHKEHQSFAEMIAEGHIIFHFR